MRRPRRRPVRLVSLLVAATALLLTCLVDTVAAATPIDPDLVVANWESGTVSVLIGKGDGSFEPQVPGRLSAPEGRASRLRGESSGPERGRIGDEDGAPRRQQE